MKPGATPVGPIDYPHPNLTEVKKKTIQDRVQLPRLYLTWITPAHFEPGDAELDVLSLLLAGGKNSRLYKRLVYDLQIAQDVAAFQASKTLNSEYQIVVTARPDASIDKIRGIVDEEIAKIQQAPAGEREFTPRDQPGRVVVLRPDGAGRRLRRRRRSDERLLLRHRQSRATSTRTCRATARCRRPTSGDRAAVPAARTSASS